MNTAKLCGFSLKMEHNFNVQMSPFTASHTIVLGVRGVEVRSRERGFREFVRSCCCWIIAPIKNRLLNRTIY